MKGLSRILPPFAPDYGGVCEVLFELGGLILIHDASGCTVNYVHFDEPRWSDTASAVYCSGLSEIDAVMGDDSVLINKAIKSSSILKPNFIAFVGSSVPMVVGTDFEGIAMECEASCGLPCMGFAANGIRNYINGASDALLALTKRFCGQKTENRGLGILGLLPLGFSSLEETKNVKNQIVSRYSSEKGYDRFISPGFDMDFMKLAELQNVGENLVVSSAGLETAEYMKKKYGIPYKVEIPYDKDCFCDIMNALDTKTAEMSLTHPKTRILIIGEGVEAFSLKKVIDSAYGSDLLEENDSRVTTDVLDLFGSFEEAVWHSSDESEIKRISADYDLVIADSCFSMLVGKEKIIPRNMIAVSGY